MSKPMLVCFLVVLGVSILTVRIYGTQFFGHSTLFLYYAYVTSFLIGFRLLFASAYRTPRDSGYEPSISIIIAAKDEEKGIAMTIRHCMASNYPVKRKEIIIIDDGSSDGTWDVLTSLKLENPWLLMYRFPENRGKRAAMEYGIQNAKGEILVFVDSDTMVRPDAIRLLVQPFTDYRVGAVSGHVRVDVSGGGVIPRMEAVRYFISHRLFKASESIFSCVTCCPGAFSAYRKSKVLKVLHPWLNRSYLGIKATFGDDRSLTNLILRKNKVIFHSKAEAFTEVPDYWMKFFRQQIRWKKSWFIESPRAISILSRKNLIAFMLHTSGVLVSLATPIVVFADVARFFYSDSMYAFSHVFGIMAVSLFFALLFYVSTGSRHWYYGLAFTIVYLTVLSWLTYYAIATVRRTEWGTR